MLRAANFNTPAAKQGNVEGERERERERERL
jgi:hypothetical protein